MIDVTHWYYPQIFMVLWLAWRFFSQLRKCLSKEHRAHIRARSPATNVLSERTLTMIENVAAPFAVLTVYGPCMLLLYLGGFFS